MDRRLVGDVSLVATYLSAVDYKEVRVAKPVDAAASNDDFLVDEQVGRLWVPIEEEATKYPAALAIGVSLRRVWWAVLGRVQRAVSTSRSRV